MSEGVFDPSTTLNDVVGGTLINDTMSRFPFDEIAEYKEYWIVGLVVLLIIGYYSYDLVLKNNNTLKVMLDK